MALSPFRGISLFAGVGGLELGLSILEPRLQTVCIVEREAFAVASIIKKMQAGFLDECPIWSDVKTFDGTKWRGKVDFISAGFPCQPFSKAGKLKGTDDQRWLWHDIARIINEVRPQFIFLENVSAFLNSWDGVATVLRSLAQSGYDAQWECFKASEVGASHHRNRFFLFAYWKGSPLAYSNSHGFNLERSDISESRPSIISQRELAWSEFGQCGSNVPYSNGSSRKQFLKRMGLSNVEGGGSNVPHSNGFRLRETTNGRINSFNSTGPKQIQREGFNQWRQIEPSLDRLVNDAPHRVDRLRASGNAVVPLQAAYAFYVLTSKAGFNFGGD